MKRITATFLIIKNDEVGFLEDVTAKTQEFQTYQRAVEIQYSTTHEPGVGIVYSALILQYREAD
jgi:hypothetical protein